MIWRLVRKDGSEVHPGDELTDFRGEKAILRKMFPPPSPDKSGKVAVDGHRMSNRTLYCTVFGLEFQEDSPGVEQ